MPLLSVAMMVRNEAVHLERCLRALAPLKAELVIVDTGSTDKTVKIAKRFTDKVYVHPWQNNFSLHRNQSIGYCTGEWILQVDADEELIWDDPADGPNVFKATLAQLPEDISGLMVPIRDWRESKKQFASEMDAPRVFRRGRVKYRRRVHNSPEFLGRVGAWRRFYLKHYGYDLTPEQTKAKAERTIPLLHKSFEEDPKDYDCLFYLCQAYAAWKKEYDKALVYGYRYLDHQEELGDCFNESIFHSIAAMLIGQKKFSVARDAINQGLTKWPQNLDLWYDTLKIAIAEGDSVAIAKASQNYIHSVRALAHARTQRVGHFFFHTDPASVANGLYYLAISYLESGVNEMNNLTNVLPMCPEGLQGEIKSKLAGCLKSLHLEDLSNRRLIIPGV